MFSYVIHILSLIIFNLIFGVDAHLKEISPMLANEQNYFCVEKYC